MKSLFSDNRCNSIPNLRLIFIAIGFIIILGFTKDVNAAQKNLPFQPGEKLIFQAKWSIVPVGEIILEVLPMATVNGAESHHFAITTKTYSFMDIFYKIREKADAYTDADMTRSVLYKKESKGKHPRNVVVNFNWEKHEATYSNFEEKMKPIAILPGSFDPLSIFFVIRLHDLKESLEIKMPVTDGKKRISVKATVLKREDIKVANKTYDTYLVEPDIESISDIFKKSKDPKVKIWFTADERKIPVKIKSRLGVGSFIFELVSAEY